MRTSAAAARFLIHRHPMRVVTRRTGLSAEILRVWERRYQVVTPSRTQTGRRLYSDADIERLHLLSRATLGGRTIGAVADLPNEEIKELLRQDAAADLARNSVLPDRGDADLDPARQFVRDCIRALDRFEPAALGAMLHRAAIALPATVFLEHVVAAVLEQVGTRWHEGSFRPVHGHLAATVVRRVLENTTVAPPPPAPRMLMATVTGQIHELGAMIVAAAAAADGWSVTWLGANLPATDIADAVVRLRVRAVGVSLIHPMGDPAVTEELRRLRALMPPAVELLVGGSAAASYHDVLTHIGVEPITDLSAFRSRLQEISAKTPATQRKPRGRRTPAAKNSRRVR